MNKSTILRNAHAIARNIRNTFANYAQALSNGLRQAWAQAKGAVKRTAAELVAFINEEFGSKASLWEKNGLSRIYFVGYKTKKVKQSLYFCLNSGEFKAYTECYNQPMSWCISQNDQARAKHAEAVAFLKASI